MSDVPPWRPPPPSGPPPGPPGPPPGPPGPPWGPPGSWGPRDPGPRRSERRDAVVPAVAAGGAFVPLTIVVSLVSFATELPVLAAAVLGGLALVGAGLLFVPRWAVRGIGMGLLIGWAVMSVITAGLCTGLNPTLYSSS